MGSVHLPPFEGVRRQRLPFFWKMHPEGFLLHSLFLLRPNTSQDSVASGSGASGTGVNGGSGLAPALEGGRQCQVSAERMERGPPGQEETAQAGTAGAGGTALLTHHTSIRNSRHSSPRNS